MTTCVDLKVVTKLEVWIWSVRSIFCGSWKGSGESERLYERNRNTPDLGRS